MRTFIRKDLPVRLLASLFVIVAASGCVPMRPMAINKNTQSVDTDNRGIVLLSVKLLDKYPSPARPNLKWLSLGDPDKDAVAIPQNERGAIYQTERGAIHRARYVYKLGPPFRSKSDKSSQFEEHLISMKLEPGRHVLKEVFMITSMFPLGARGHAPIFSTFEVRPNQVTYLGHIEILRRVKKCHEFRAGSPAALIDVDSAVLGYSTGTFDINIFDNYDRDVSVFRREYPVLAKYSVTKSILAAWKRPSEDDPASCTDTPSDGSSAVN